MFGGCRPFKDAYDNFQWLGEGAYGEVYKARDIATKEIVAIKKIKMGGKEGFPITAVREIKILSMLGSAPDTFRGDLLRDNIITLREIVRSDKSVYMVFDYMQHDMAGLLDRAAAETRRRLGKKTPFEIGQVKRYMRQLLLGLVLLKRYKILHRDLKNANLLVNNRGELKIADFGLARSFLIGDEKDASDGEQKKNPLMTNRVITLWYRPPELCLGCEEYGAEVDMWSAGCILVEMLLGKALFPGKDEANQIELIFSMLGAPDEKNETWKK